MYSPKLREDQIMKLYQLCGKTGKPMTLLIREAVESYLKKEGMGQVSPLGTKTPQKAIQGVKNRGKNRG